MNTFIFVLMLSFMIFASAVALIVFHEVCRLSTLEARHVDLADRHADLFDRLAVLSKVLKEVTEATGKLSGDVSVLTLRMDLSQRGDSFLVERVEQNEADLAAIKVGVSELRVAEAKMAELAVAMEEIGTNQRVIEKLRDDLHTMTGRLRSVEYGVKNLDKQAGEICEITESLQDRLRAIGVVCSDEDGLGDDDEDGAGESDEPDHDPCPSDSFPVISCGD